MRSGEVSWINEKTQRDLHSGMCDARLQPWWFSPHGRAIACWLRPKVVAYPLFELDL
jgi:hypothetical protein